MNVAFLRVLQSIHDLEKDPNFRSKKYAVVDKHDRQVDPGQVPVVLEYPDNVIVVASPTGKAPPAAIGERRFASLSEALFRAVFTSQFGFKGCSIVVHEGMYIDPKFCFSLSAASNDFALEIIGVKEVRILLKSSDPVLLQIDNVKITMKNISIYESSSNDIVIQAADSPSITAKELTFVDVRMRGCHLTVECNEGSRLKVIDCVFSNYPTSFVMKRSRAEFRNCLWYHHFQNEENGSTELVANAVLVAGGSASFHKCRFIRKSGFEGQTDGFACRVVRQGEITVKETLVSGFYVAFLAENSDSKIVLDRCEIFDGGIAVNCQLNSSATVTKCKLGTDLVLRCMGNETGEFKFQRNTLRPGPSFGGVQHNVAFIDTDRELKKLKHDFARVKIIYSSSTTKPPSYGASRKSREDFAQYCSSSDMARVIPPATRESRRCVFCDEDEKDKPEAKFQYCIRCKRARYCSRECQQSDWRDHKLMCKKV